ncbi:single-stranded DNA-binding protein [Mesomycoplasma lagogenitalium]|uniref:Single-stranded DNA-binding protein n=1 Tax=Mesomycoplasma lagogenitalium TaxID=171286 RepID=A0ABY8LSY7_9BACT|nr:single-stranded DNA-binding protein [Mesomycoplasma lagogenitalium]WGI36364.1 single-stranded DNA-binding protein [Mesomycoplasma lagogenitalium]
MNKVILIGRIASNIELQKTKSNISYIRINVAVSRRYSSNDGSDITDFIPVVAWRNTAEFIAKNAAKGSRISVEGSFVSNSFTNSQGQNVTSNEVSAENISLLETKETTERRKNNSFGQNSNNYSTPNTFNESQPTFSTVQPLNVKSEINKQELNDEDEADWDVDSFI